MDQMVQISVALMTGGNSSGPKELKIREIKNEMNDRAPEFHLLLRHPSSTAFSRVVGSQMRCNLSALPVLSGTSCFILKGTSSLFQASCSSLLLRRVPVSSSSRPSASFLPRPCFMPQLLFIFLGGDYYFEIVFRNLL